MPKCRYKGCNEEALPDSPDGYCIFHEDIENKDVKRCMELFYEKLKRGERKFDGYVLKDIDFTKAGIKNIKQKITFIGAKFYGTTYLRDITFEKADFSDAKFEGINFLNAKFKEANFMHVKFVLISCQKTEFKEANFIGANIELANFSETKFEKVDFSEAIFDSVSFSKVDFEEAHFMGVKCDSVRFSKAKFREVFFTGATFRWVDFSETNFEVADFTGANFQEAYFTKARFGEVYFVEANFGEADFTRAKFQKATFTGAQFRKMVNFSEADIKIELNFEKAILNRALFDKTNLTKIRFYSAFIETAIISRAIFGNKCFIEEKEAISMEEKLKESFSCWKMFLLRKDKEKIKKFRLVAEKFREAEDVYRNVKLSLQNEGDYETAGEFYYKEMLMRRKRAFYEGRFLYWILSNIYSKLCGYGEKPLRVILSAFITILFFGTLYWLMDAITGEGFSGSVFDYYYFSVVTFTTLGFGDIHPATFPGKLAAMAEALIGAFMMALFVLVFGRKMLR